MNRTEQNIRVKEISAKSNLRPAEIKKKVSRLNSFPPHLKYTFDFFLKNCNNNQKLKNRERKFCYWH